MSDFIARNECTEKHNTMAKDINDIKTDINSIKVSIASLPEKIIVKTDEKYAGKRVERMVDWLIKILISLFVTALFGIVLMQNK